MYIRSYRNPLVDIFTTVAAIKHSIETYVIHIFTHKYKYSNSYVHTNICLKAGAKT